jgi:hypothetical protein
MVKEQMICRREYVKEPAPQCCTEYGVAKEQMIKCQGGSSIEVRGESRFLICVKT